MQMKHTSLVKPNVALSQGRDELCFHLQFHESVIVDGKPQAGFLCVGLFASWQVLGVVVMMIVGLLVKLTLSSRYRCCSRDPVWHLIPNGLFVKFDLRSHIVATLAD